MPENLKNNSGSFFAPKLLEDSIARLAYRVMLGKFYTAIARGSQRCTVRANADLPSPVLERILKQIALAAAWQ